MARDEDEERSTDEKIQRQVARTITNWLVVIVSLGVIGAWAYQGLYELAPGEAAVILRLGAFDRTVADDGLHWHWPAPLEYSTKVNVTQLRQQQFGLAGEGTPQPGAETATEENAIQTADSNIVNLSYALQYQVDDAYTFVYGMAEPDATLHDATQSAVREVVGHKTVDQVLSAQRAQIETESRRILQTILEQYFDDGHSAFDIQRIGLQIVQPPVEVQDAFDDVVAAQQDLERAKSEAEGDQREIVERANAEAAELRAGALAYKEAKILESQGEANRFESVLAEYRRAPEVTRRRLYLETMEQVLPEVDKVIVEPDTVNMVPFLPIPGAQR